MISEWVAVGRGSAHIHRAGRRMDATWAHHAGLWHVLQTKGNQEKAVATALADAGAEPFLPVFRRTMHYGHRRRRVEIPVFSGYVFARGNRDHAVEALRTGRVVRLVPVADQATFEFEITQIRRAIAGDAALSPYRFLTRGVPVRVRSGPFKDLHGVVDDAEKAGRLVLRIQALGRALSLEIDACLLEREDDLSGS